MGIEHEQRRIQLGQLTFKLSHGDIACLRRRQVKPVQQLVARHDGLSQIVLLSQKAAPFVLPAPPDLAQSLV